MGHRSISGGPTSTQRGQRGPSRMSWHLRESDAEIVYEQGTEFFTVIMHHGGHLLEAKYIEGSVDYFDFCEKDTLSMYEIHSMAEMVGHRGLKVYFRKKPGVEGWSKIQTDDDVIEMCGQLPLNRHIDIYQEYRRNVYGKDYPGYVVQEYDMDDVKGDEEEEDDDSSYKDSDYEMEEDDILFEKYVDVNVEHNDSSNLGDVNDDATFEGGINSDEDIYSVNGFDIEAEEGRRFLEFNAVTDMDNPIFCVGMLFNDKKQLSEALKNASIKDRVNITFKKNDKIRFRAICKESCEWSLYARKFKKTQEILHSKSEHTMPSIPVAKIMQIETSPIGSWLISIKGTSWLTHIIH